MIRLTSILKEIHEEDGIYGDNKNVLTSNPNPSSIKKFHEITEKIAKIFHNSKSLEKTHLYTNEDSTNMFKGSTVNKSDLKHHVGEYKGNNFKEFTDKLANLYEKAGFKVEYGYGIDDIKGFEIKDHNGDVVGEVDFLEKDQIPNYGDTIIIKHKKHD